MASCRNERSRPTGPPSLGPSAAEQPKISLIRQRRPALLRAFAEALLGGRLTRPIGALSELIADPAGYSSSTRADWATGAVTMMSRECVTRAGPWDESFFLYSEETEFELRAADAGFRLAFADVDVVHLGGESRVRPELWSLLCANRVRLYGMRHRRVPATLASTTCQRRARRRRQPAGWRGR